MNYINLSSHCDIITAKKESISMIFIYLVQLTVQSRIHEIGTGINALKNSRFT